MFPLILLLKVWHIYPLVFRSDFFESLFVKLIVEKQQKTAALDFSRSHPLSSFPDVSNHGNDIAHNSQRAGSTQSLNLQVPAAVPSACQGAVTSTMARASAERNRNTITYKFYRFYRFYKWHKMDTLLIQNIDVDTWGAGLGSAAAKWQRGARSDRVPRCSTETLRFATAIHRDGVLWKEW